MDYVRKRWPIMERVETQLAEHVQSFMVIGDKGEAAILATEDGSCYWIGTIQFERNRWQDRCGDSIETVTKSTKLEIGGKLVAMAQGREQVALLNEFGEIYVFGLNDLGQLAQGYSDDQIHFTPLLIDSHPEHRFVDIQCGWNYSVALTTDGKVLAWGWNHCGQVGLDSTVASHQCTLRQISELDSHQIVQIRCGEGHTLALTSQGEVYAWGRNQCGQLGHSGGDNDNVFGKHMHRPTKMDAPGQVKSVAAGQRHTLLLMESGEIYACGDNQFGQLGLQSTFGEKFNSKLLKVSGLPGKISQISSHFGTDLSIAMTSDRTCYVWGQSTTTNDGDYQTGNPIPTKMSFDYFTFDSVLSICIRNTSGLVLVKDYRNGPKLVAPQRLMDRLSRMFDNPETSDIRFVFNECGNTIHAHRPILQMSSLYFNRMFSHHWNPSLDSQNSVSTISITIYSYSTFYAYLRFLYTGIFQIGPESIEELLDLANCYLEPELQQLCNQWIVSNLSVEECCHYYQLAEQYSLKELQSKLVEYIGDYLDQIVRTSSYQSMAQDERDKLISSIQQQQHQNQIQTQIKT